jgi:hypothetical protein
MQQSVTDDESSTPDKKQVIVLRHDELKLAAYETVDAVIQFTSSRNTTKRNNPSMPRDKSTVCMKSTVELFSNPNRKWWGFLIFSFSERFSVHLVIFYFAVRINPNFLVRNKSI